MTKWIKVSECRPEIGQVVQCFNKSKYPDFRFLTLKHESPGKYYELIPDDGDDDDYNERGWYDEKTITHWAELPNEPGKITDEDLENQLTGKAEGDDFWLSTELIRRLIESTERFLFVKEEANSLIFFDTEWEDEHSFGKRCTLEQLMCKITTFYSEDFLHKGEQRIKRQVRLLLDIPDFTPQNTNEC